MHSPRTEKPKALMTLAEIKSTLIEEQTSAMRQLTQSSIRAKEAKQLDQGAWYAVDYIDWCAKMGKPKDKHANLDYYADEKFWKVVFDEKGAPVFSLLKDKKPSDAICAFFTGFAKIDCNIALVICQYASLLRLFGDEKFDALFSDLSMQPTTDQNPCSFFYDSLEWEEKKQDDCLVGDHCFQPGVKDYERKHPAGIRTGEHVFLLEVEKGKKRLISFGFEGTEEELSSLLVEDYKRDRSPMDLEYINELRIPPWLLPGEEGRPIVMGGPMYVCERPNVTTIAKYMKMDIALLNPESRFQNMLQAGIGEFDNLIKFLKLYPIFARVERLKGCVDKWNLNDDQLIQLLARMPYDYKTDEGLNLLELFKEQLAAKFEILLIIHNLPRISTQEKKEKLYDIMQTKLKIMIDSKEKFEKYCEMIPLTRLDNFLVLFQDKLKDWMTLDLLFTICKYQGIIKAQCSFRQYLTEKGIDNLDDFVPDGAALLNACVTRIGAINGFQQGAYFKFLENLSDKKLVAIINTKELFEQLLVKVHIWPNKKILIARMMQYPAGREVVLAAAKNPDFIKIYFEDDENGPIVKKMIEDALLPGVSKVNMFEEERKRQGQAEVRYLTIGRPLKGPGEQDRD